MLNVVFVFLCYISLSIILWSVVGRGVLLLWSENDLFVRFFVVSLFLICVCFL